MISILAILGSSRSRRNYLAGNGLHDLRVYNVEMAIVGKGTSVATKCRLGELLRQWRTNRRMSQLDLALEAEISSRHLSFIESGRTQPSREMLTRLADALAIALRERNALYIAAGFAPVYRETGLTAPEMALANQAIDFILRQQEPYPAIVIDRQWNVIRGNRGAQIFIDFLLGSPPKDPNVVRQLFSADMLRPFIVNWDEMATDMIRRLHQEIDWVPTDAVLQDLLAEILRYPGVPEHWRTRQMETRISPLLDFIWRKGDVELRFFSTWTTFGSPHDVTLEELRIESSFPSDEHTAAVWQDIVSGMHRR